MSSKSFEIKIVEVGARDGLQNEPKLIGIKDKVWLVRSLVAAGVQDLELGAFVRPDRVPQMADTDQLCKNIIKGKNALRAQNLWCLVPNRKGLERALRAGIRSIALFTAATDSFARKNIGMSINESVDEMKAVIREGRTVLGSELRVRAYISTAFGCPFEGRVSYKRSLAVVEKLANLKVDEISIGDTIGVANPMDVEKLMKPALSLVGATNLAIHLHDTRGTALANALKALDVGIRTFDSSLGGLGGCPFAPGASGNLATEDLLYMLNGMNLKTGINLEKLCKISLKLALKLKKPVASKFVQAYSTSKITKCFL